MIESHHTYCLAYVSSLSRETNSSALLPGVVLYQREADALSAEWDFTDSSSEVAHVRYAVGTYPGAEDVISTTDSSVQMGEGALPSTVVDLNAEGDCEETWQL